MTGDYFYHGTGSAHLPSIRRRGLRPPKDHLYVSFTSAPLDAARFGNALLRCPRPDESNVFPHHFSDPTLGGIWWSVKGGVPSFALSLYTGHELSEDALSDDRNWQPLVRDTRSRGRRTRGVGS